MKVWERGRENRGRRGETNRYSERDKSTVTEKEGLG